MERWPPLPEFGFSLAAFGSSVAATVVLAGLLRKRALGRIP